MQNDRYFEFSWANGLKVGGVLQRSHVIPTNELIKDYSDGKWFGGGDGCFYLQDNSETLSPHTYRRLFTSSERILSLVLCVTLRLWL